MTYLLLYILSSQDISLTFYQNIAYIHFNFHLKEHLLQRLSLNCASYPSDNQTGGCQNFRRVRSSGGWLVPSPLISTGGCRNNPPWNRLCMILFNLNVLCGVGVFFIKIDILNWCLKQFPLRDCYVKKNEKSVNFIDKLKKINCSEYDFFMEIIGDVSYLKCAHKRRIWNFYKNLWLYKSLHWKNILNLT